VDEFAVAVASVVARVQVGDAVAREAAGIHRDGDEAAPSSLHRDVRVELGDLLDAPIIPAMDAGVGVVSARLVPMRHHGQRERALNVWSEEPELDVPAGLGLDPSESSRDAVEGLRFIEFDGGGVAGQFILHVCYAKQFSEGRPGLLLPARELVQSPGGACEAASFGRVEVPQMPKYVFGVAAVGCGFHGGTSQ